MMQSRRQWKLLSLLLVMVLLLVACERPLTSGDDESAEQSAEATAVVESAVDEAVQPADESDAASEEDQAEAGQASGESAEAETGGEETAPSDEAESTDPNVGGGTPETAEDDATSGAESSEDGAATESDSAAETTEDTAGTSNDEAATTEGSESTSDEAAATETTDESAAEETTTTEDAATLPATHTVAPGENLYRIGLKYGLSWVVLAQYNNLPNADYIYVGQVLYLPGGGQPAPTPPPTPAPPPTDSPGYTNYVVQRGDTLNSIGRKFGVSWVEIAEANGIVNPNLIYAGQVLKIPTSDAVTPPSVTHVVQSGETLYRISLQYGVHWLAIAQDNHITAPYVIYPGQVLTIPSG